MWITPKTNWVYSDYVNISDYDRIMGNMAYLRETAIMYNTDFKLLPMQAVAYSDLPFEEILNTIEKNVQILADKTLRTEAYPSEKQYEENGHMLNWEDLNRIEGALGLLLSYIMSQVENRRTLAYRLGGETNAAGI